jgi:hypothetical protein
MKEAYLIDDLRKEKLQRICSGADHDIIKRNLCVVSKTKKPLIFLKCSKDLKEGLDY